MRAWTLAVILVLGLGCAGEDEGAKDSSPGVDVGDPGDGGLDSLEGQDSEPALDTLDSEAGQDTVEGEDGVGGQIFVPPAETTTYVYRVEGAGPEVAAADLPAKYGPKEDYNGHIYRRMDVGDFTVAEPIGVKIWTLYENDTLQTGGAQVFNPGTNGEFTFAYAFDEPLLGNLNGEVDVPQVTNTTGKFTIMGFDSPFEITLTYTLKSLNASITVPAGTFDGCIHYEIIEDSTDLQGFKAEYWLKSGVGMIKATVIPGFGGVELVSYEQVAR